MDVEAEPHSGRVAMGLEHEVHGELRGDLG